MLTRFKQNVRMYPRTAAVVGALYLGAIIGSVVVGVTMHLNAGRQLFTLLALVGVVAFVDGLTYLWVVNNAGRLNFVLEMLNDFEGRGCQISDCEECEINSEEEGYSLLDDEEGQDVAEYAVMLAVILVIALGTIRLIGSQAGNVFSAIGSQIQ